MSEEPVDECCEEDSEKEIRSRLRQQRNIWEREEDEKEDGESD